MCSTHRASIGPQHQWREDDLLVLALLYKIYGNEKSTLLRCFNAINREILEAEGFQNGMMPIEDLQTWHCDMERNQHPVLTRVRNSPLNVLRHMYRVQRDMIEDAAQLLNITLELRVEPPSAPLPFSHLSTQALPVRTPTSAMGPVVRDDWSSTTASSDEDNDGQPATSAATRQAINARAIIRSYTHNPHKAQKVDKNESHPALSAQPIQRRALESLPCNFTFDFCVHTSQSTPPSDCVLQPQENISPYDDARDKHGYIREVPLLFTNEADENGKQTKHPVLLFRAFNPNTGFRARRFAGSEKITSPPAFLSSEFRRDIEKHLRFDTEHDSPFLSLTASSRRAFNIVLRSKAETHFAVFTYSGLREEKRSKLWLIPHVCEKHRLDDLHVLGTAPTRGSPYRGRDEFVIWGEIKTKPIAILRKQEVQDLVTAIGQIKSCVGGSGANLLPFLRDIEEPLRETFLRFLMVQHKKPGCELSKLEAFPWLSFVSAAGCPIDPDLRRSASRSVAPDETTRRSGILPESDTEQSESDDGEEDMDLSAGGIKNDASQDTVLQCAVDAQLAAEVQAHASDTNSFTNDNDRELQTDAAMDSMAGDEPTTTSSHVVIDLTDDADVETDQPSIKHDHCHDGVRD